MDTTTAAAQTFTFVVWVAAQQEAETRQAVGVNLVAAEELVRRFFNAGDEVLAAW